MLYQRYFLRMNQSNTTHILALLLTLILALSCTHLVFTTLQLRRNLEVPAASGNLRLERLLLLAENGTAGNVSRLASTTPVTTTTTPTTTWRPQQMEQQLVQGMQNTNAEQQQQQQTGNNRLPQRVKRKHYRRQHNKQRFKQQQHHHHHQLHRHRVR